MSTSITLTEAIDQAINLGQSSPEEISQHVIAAHGPQIILAEIDAGEYCRQLARKMLSQRRRANISSLAKIDTSRRRELMLDVVWLPGIGYMKLGEMTVERWQSAAATYRKGEATLRRYAEWCEAQADLMIEQGVSTYRQVKGPLPELPAAA